MGPGFYVPSQGTVFQVWVWQGAWYLGRDVVVSSMQVGNPLVPGSGSFPFPDVDEDRKLSAEEVRKYAQEQGIEISDLVDTEEK